MSNCWFKPNFPIIEEYLEPPLQEDFQDVFERFLLFKIHKNSNIQHPSTCISAAEEFVVIIVDWIAEAKPPHAVPCWWIHQSAVARHSHHLQSTVTNHKVYKKLIKIE